MLLFTASPWYFFSDLMGDKPLSVQLDIIVERFLQVTAVCYHMSFMFLMPFVAMFLPLYLVSFYKNFEPEINFMSKHKNLFFRKMKKICLL